MRKPDHVQVTVRKHPRGRTTSVECRLCGTVQPLVAPGRRTPSEADIDRVIHLFGALHDQTCRDRVEGLVATMQADEPKAETIGYLHVGDAVPTEGEK
jgi:hypothetical protein